PIATNMRQVLYLFYCLMPLFVLQHAFLQFIIEIIEKAGGIVSTRFIPCKKGGGEAAPTPA
ncbi:hypothetical protein C3F00_034300, partial [Pseudomonas sp. MWU13-2860]